MEKSQSKTNGSSKVSDEFGLMERRDEDQILAELRGHYLEEFVYSFEAGGRRVIGLSWAGVKECAYRLGGINVESCEVLELEDAWRVVAKAVNKVDGSSRWGACQQPKKMRYRDGAEVVDEFALQKAVSKAQRNAIRALLPEIFIKTFIDRYLEEKKRVTAFGSKTQV